MLHSKTAGMRYLLSTSLPVEFPIELADDLFRPDNSALLRVGSTGKGARRIVVIDERVYDLFGERIEAYFVAHHVEYRVVPVVATETTKDLDLALAIVQALEDFHVLRQSEPVIAVGGGVLLDVAGFAASMYRRGLPYIRVPTTLLSLVDASVGAKTGINHLGRRNRLGSYYPPIAAYLDRSFLVTLDRKEFSNGLAEILKMALLKDPHLFELLERHGRTLIDEKFQGASVALDVIDRTIATMLEELQPNLWEKHLQRLVDFGHSFSPLLEMRALPVLSHGDAVALDMLLSCLISNGRGVLSDDAVGRVFQTVQHLGLPTFHPLFGDASALMESLADTVVHRNGSQNLPMLEQVGRAVFFNDVTPAEITTAAARLTARALGGER